MYYMVLSIANISVSACYQNYNDLLIKNTGGNSKY